MPYCVNCGVELNPQAQRCPLCQTPAWRPAPEEWQEPSYFPKEPPVVPPASRKALVVLLSAMLFSAALCCGVLNLLLLPEKFWSLYVFGAGAMVWIWFVLPLLLHGAPMFLTLTLDVAAVGVYVLLAAIDLDGMDWFRGLALPLLGVMLAVVFLLSFLVRGRSLLSVIAMTIAAIGTGALGIELCVDWYITGGVSLGWSLVICTICFALIIPLRIIRRVPSLRTAARRRFNL